MVHGTQNDLLADYRAIGLLPSVPWRCHLSSAGAAVGEVEQIDPGRGAPHAAVGAEPSNDSRIQHFKPGGFRASWRQVCQCTEQQQPLGVAGDGLGA